LALQALALTASQLTMFYAC